MDDRGDIILEGLLRTVVGLLLFGLVLFEVGAVLINQVQLDGNSQDAARTGARTIETYGSEAIAKTAVEHAAASLPGTSLDGISIEQESVTVTLSRPAPVLVAHRLPFLEERVIGTATARSRIGR